MKCTEERYKKELNDLDNHDGVVTHLKSNILEYEVKWALENITTNKGSGGVGIPVELFQILKMMLWKCCTQYASKFGKLSSGHGTGKGHFSFEPQRKTMPKNAQTTIQLSSFHMLARLCSKSFKLGFRGMWTKNSQRYKLGFEEAEEPESKLPTFVGTWRKQGNSRKTSTSASLSMLKPLTLWITTNCAKFLKRWEY